MSMFPMTFDFSSGDFQTYRSSSSDERNEMYRSSSYPSSDERNANEMYRSSSYPSSDERNEIYRSSSYPSSAERIEMYRSSSGASYPSTEEDLPLASTWPRPRQTAADLWDVDNSKLELDLSHQLAEKLLKYAPDGLVELDDQNREDTANPRFKTEICRNYKEKGTCLYGDLCQFAHGRDELRMKDRHMNVSQDVVRHNKYKTKLCQKFWIAGYCAYGSRCNFIHNENEREAYNDNYDANIGAKETSMCCPKEVNLFMPPPRQLPPRIAARNDLLGDSERKTSVGDRDSGDSGSDFGGRAPSLSPPGNSILLHKPMFGSGRFAAHQSQGDIFTWVDTWTQKYL